MRRLGGVLALHHAGRGVLGRQKTIPVDCATNIPDHCSKVRVFEGMREC